MEVSGCSGTGPCVSAGGLRNVWDNCAARVRLREGSHLTYLITKSSLGESLPGPTVAMPLGQAEFIPYRFLFR